MKKIIFIFFISISVFTFGQTENLNQLDAKGKRDGKWILYLDAIGAKVDSSKATYSRFTYYNHGRDIYNMGHFISKNGKIGVKENNPQTHSKIKQLDGEYKCYTKKGQLKFIHVFKNGEYVSYKEFFSSGELETYFDYAKHCHDQPHSWFLYVYDKKGGTKYQNCICNYDSVSDHL